ncbi:MAG: multicopper oxidase domain-containing protein [Simkaniaceae bacterium]|nr:multicopper oxidase domain-containing protein [Simkaniaceae bacterium]
MKKYSLFALILCSLFASDEISIKETTIEVKGKKEVRPAIEGRTEWNVGDTFNVTLVNDLGNLSSLHFQGLISPNSTDGTPYLTEAPLGADRKVTYSFPLTQAGTYFFVASFGLQQQSLLAAPLIVLDPLDTRKQVLMLLEDFSFKQGGEIWQDLRNHVYDRSPRQNSTTKTVLSEIEYDAYLTNKRSLENPEVIEVPQGVPVRLRIMNASSMTNFFINTGTLTGTVLAVDAQDIEPVQDSLFEIAPGQRLDLEITLSEAGAFPILGEAEGTDKQTGLILKTRGAVIPIIPSRLTSPQGRPITLKNEFRYIPKNPLPAKSPNRSFALKLQGDTFHYVWSINGLSWPKVTPLPVKMGERIEMVIDNQSQVTQVISLHGHTFQIVNIDGTVINGALRDTLYILPQQAITIQFDANNRGIWPLSSTQLFHRWGGMMTYILYEDFKPLYFTDGIQNSYYYRYSGRPLSPGEALEIPDS